MNDSPKVLNDAFSPDTVLRSVQEAAVVFIRDTETNLPSGDEVRQLMDKGIKWRWVVAGYLRDLDGGCISAFASSNDLKPAEDWQEKAYRKVIITLANAFMKKLIERQNAQRDEETKILHPEPVKIVNP